MMPFQNLTKYRQEGQNEGTELSSALSASLFEETLDLERKIDAITRYQKPYTKKILLTMARANPYNALTVYNYIVAQKNEQNIKESTVEGIIKKLVWLSSHLKHKSFSEMTKEDILDYLNSIKKPPELDPTHKSIGTYNGRQMVFSTFFRWLYNQDEPDCRKRITPPCMNGVRKLPRQEKSPYKPSDLWSGEEHQIFLKYCPNKRDRCYHAMANDTSARPHELLNLRIKDIIFKTSDSEVQYAEIQVSGKTRPRTLPLINSITYIKDWMREHPTSDNQDSWLFIGASHNNYTYRISEDGMRWRYKYYYQNTYFTGLLKDETVSPRDKSYIKTMLMKPWNLYIFRHSALTEKSQILKESTLRDHAGWSNTSQMPLQLPKSYPFLKWAGGKTQLLSKIDRFIPQPFSRYFEPFLGGGAMFFYLVSDKNLRFTAYLSDINAELINVYKMVRNDSENLVRILADYQKGYNRSPSKFYYSLRDNFNPQATNIQRAARTIALNKTCYNGLYRVNRAGKFNVPIGRYKNPVICHSSNLRNLSLTLRNSGAHLCVSDYKDILLNKTKNNDFIYLDPPYNPVSRTASFTGYTYNPFTEEDQKELSELFVELSKRGCKVLLSNSDTHYIRGLYAHAYIHQVRALRSINSRASKRSGHKELLICNYHVQAEAWS